MKNAFLIKYAEIAIKGKNRYMFEDALIHQMKLALAKVDGEFQVTKEQGRIYVNCMGDYDQEETVQVLQKVFGIVGICPVAGYMIAKRGVRIDAVYFHAPPYTSERAKQKVVDLARLVAQYSGPIALHVVNFTDIQLYIYDQCPHEELTIIMRRYMMRIAEHFARQRKCLGLITGESIGQVASQTMQSLAATDEVCTLPVYRPVIGFDKQEIVEIAHKINTFETSIQPFEDCCTIFVAKHPVTKPNLNIIHRSETKLTEKIDALVEEAIRTVEIIQV